MFFRTPTAAAAALPEIYDAIASDFNATRQAPWAELERLFERTPPSAKILDLGCGNGRLVPLFQQKNCAVIGVDPAEKLLEFARKSFPETEFLRGDFAHIPLANESCDEVWAVASFHHLPSVTMRKEALQEVSRVLKLNGSLVLTVWNLWELPQYKNAEMKAFWRAVFLPRWKRQDFLIPWGKEKIPRYYYAFRLAELQDLVVESGFKLVEAFTTENICLRFQKIALS